MENLQPIAFDINSLGSQEEPQVFDINSLSTQGEQQLQEKEVTPQVASYEDVTLFDRAGNAINAFTHDGDTLYTNKGGLRLVGFDTPETTKISSTGGFSAGSSMGGMYTNVLKDAIKNGYNIVDYKGKDKYNRDLVEISNKNGEKVSTFLVANRLLNPSQYTPEQDLSARAVKSFSELINGVNKNDPVVKSRMLIEDALNEYTPLLKTVTYDQQTINDFKTYSSNEYREGLEKSITKLSTELISSFLPEEERIKKEKQLDVLKNNLQLSLNMPKNPYIHSIEWLNSTPRTTTGELADAVHLGWIGMKKMAVDFEEYIGDVTNSESLIKDAKLKAVDIDSEARKVKAVTGLKDVDSIGKGVQFVANTLVGYGPQFGVMVAGSVAGGKGGAALGGAVGGPVGAAVGGTAGSLAVPVIMGIASVYGEMPDGEKNPEVATAAGMLIGVLDRFGFSRSGITGKELLTKEGRELIAQKIAAKEGIPIAEARGVLNKSVDDITKDVAQLIKENANEQIIARKQFKDILTSVVGRSGKEGATEMLQEVIQYGVVTGTTSNVFDWVTMRDRVLEAGVQGAIIGGTMSIPSSIREKQMFNELASEYMGLETKPRSWVSQTADKWREKTGGKTLNDIDLAHSVRGESVNNYKEEKLSDLFREEDKPNMGEKSLWAALNPYKWFASSRNNKLKDYIDTEFGQQLAGLFDAPIIRGVFAGLSPYKRAKIISSSVQAHFSSFFDDAKTNGFSDSKSLGNFLYDTHRNNKFESLSPELKSYYLKKMEELRVVGNVLANELENLELGKDKSGRTTGWNTEAMRNPSFFLENQLLSPTKIRAEKELFIQKLMEASTVIDPGDPDNIAGISRDEATKLANLLEYDMSPATMKRLHDLGVLKHPALQGFLNDNIQDNMLRFLDRVALSAVRNTIFGEQGEVLAKLVKKGLASGTLTEQKARELAAELDDKLKSFDGVLHSVESPTLKGAQENINFVSTLVYMDTAFFANLSEIAYGSLGLSPKNQAKYIGKFAKLFAADILSLLTLAGNKASFGAIKFRKSSEIAEDYHRLEVVSGHMNETNDILLKEGVSLNSKRKRAMARIMFKVNLIETLSNSVRGARGAVAMDEINSLVSIVAEADGETNNAVRYARDRLQYYRIDIDKAINFYNMLGGLDEQSLTQLDRGHPLFDEALEMYRAGVTNFIDEFAMRPEPGSSPEIFDDHRFVLFTQFQRFTAHMTANMIPHLWSMYIKRGNPKYTYATFSAIIMAYALAWTGLYLRFGLRGDDEDDEKKKQAKEDKLYYKALEYSWLGTVPDIIDLAGDLKNVAVGEDPFKKKAETALSRMPGANTVYQINKDAYTAATGDETASRKSKDKLVEKIPFLGEIPAFRQYYDKEK